MRQELIELAIEEAKKQGGIAFLLTGQEWRYAIGVLEDESEERRSEGLDLPRGEWCRINGGWYFRSVE